MKVVCKTVPTIAVFNPDERPRPYKFRYTDDGGNTREVVVGRVLCCRESKIGSYVVFCYECQSAIDDYERKYELRYIVNEFRWELYKI